jgi:hypothetical protein
MIDVLLFDDVACCHRYHIQSFRRLITRFNLTKSLLIVTTTMSSVPVSGASAFLSDRVEAPRAPTALQFTGPFEDRVEFPRGGTSWPRLAPEDDDPDQSFPPRVSNDFENAIREGRHVSKKLLTTVRRANYCFWLNNPDTRSELTDPQARQRKVNAKHHCLKHYELSKGQVYRSPGRENGNRYTMRYAACTWDAADIIKMVHVKLHHASKLPLYTTCATLTIAEVEKVYQTIIDHYYGISIKDVAWVQAQCATCRLSARNEGKPAIKPIKSDHCLDRLVIDLMDYRTKPDGKFKWILQIKDHFSRYVWLYAMKDKESATVSCILRNWFYTNGYPKKWYVIPLICGVRQTH